MKPRTSSTFLLLNTPEHVVAANAFATESVLSIYKVTLPFRATAPAAYTIWISKEEDIYHFVQQVPELAWQMLEYAQEPLELILPNRKYKPPFEDQDTYISLRLVTLPALQQLLRRTGPLITFSLPDFVSLQEIEPFVQEKLDCKDKNNDFRQVKSMKLFTDGSFTFVR